MNLDIPTTAWPVAPSCGRKNGKMLQILKTWHHNFSGRELRLDLATGSFWSRDLSNGKGLGRYRKSTLRWLLAHETRCTGGKKGGLTKNGMFGEEVVKGKMRVSGDGGVILFARGWWLCWCMILAQIKHIYFMSFIICWGSCYILPPNINCLAISPAIHYQHAPGRKSLCEVTTHVPIKKKRQKTEVEVDHCKYAFDSRKRTRLWNKWITC